MHYDSQSAFQPYLMPGERILWTGRPKQGLALRASDALLIPASLLWTGIVLAFFISAAAETGFPSVILMLFLLFGLYFVVGRFIHDSAIRRRTAYALTDQRALFRRGSKFTSLDLSHLPKLEFQERSDGSGTIEFQESGFATYNKYGGLNWWIPSIILASSFFGIDGARDVYRMIREHSGRSSTF